MMWILLFVVTTSQRMVRGWYVGLWSQRGRCGFCSGRTGISCKRVPSEAKRGKLDGVYKPGQINRQHQKFTQQHEEGTVDVSGKALNSLVDANRTYRSFPS